MNLSKIPIARTADEVRARHAANRLAWNEAAHHYTLHVEETIAALRAGTSNVHPIERANLGDLAPWCATAIHLQCASGRDTLSLWLEGARRVVGIDISESMIANARRTSEALGAPATWHCCDILDTPHELDGTADLVYTGRGALGWIHDLAAWARVVARLLRPGGVLHVLDNHPASLLFDPDATSLVLLGMASYFEHSEAYRGWEQTYIKDEELGLPAEEQREKYVRLWTLADVFQQLRAAGLDIEHLGEHPDEYYEVFPQLPVEERRRIPQTFSLLARRPRV